MIAIPYHAIGDRPHALKHSGSRLNNEMGTHHCRGETPSAEREASGSPLEE